MRMTSGLLILAALATATNGKIAEKYLGDWLIVNGTLVLHIDDGGTMLLRNSGANGAITINENGDFTWSTTDRPRSGRFEDGKLLLRNDQKDSPKWTAYLEFRRGDKEAVREVIALAVPPQKPPERSFAQIRRLSMEKSILNNLRQLSGAADQYFMETGAKKVTVDRLVGSGKYIQRLQSVDGEDYGTLDLSSDARTWKIVSASGITVTFER